MIYIKVNETLYPASISGQLNDREWDGRASKAITLEMDYATANNLFTNGLSWSIVQDELVNVEEITQTVNEEDGSIIENMRLVPTIKQNEYDNSDYNIAGDITDHRDGTITAKMGKLTELEEAYEIMLGGIL